MIVRLSRGFLKQWLLIGGMAIPLFVIIAGLLPDPLFAPDYSTVIQARDGELLGASIAADGQWRFPPESLSSPKFVKSLIAFEDKRFYIHMGVDYIAVARALLSNLSEWKIKSGASTITMQVIRLSREAKERTFAEKLVEIVLAHRLELTETKGGILALFAAHAPYGGNVVGLDAASWRYFGRSPERLSWAEAAMLAVLPNNPGLIYPGRNRELLLDKRNRLLSKLHEANELDDDTYELSVAEPLPTSPYPIPTDAIHLLERVKKIPDTGTNPARVTTTVDYALQTRVTAILEKFHSRYLGYGIRNIAAIVTDVDTGSVLAYVGNVFDDEPENTSAYVDIVDSPRSTGSLLKPFLYAACLDSGEIYPGQLLMDIPSRLGSYIPENNSNTFQGAVAAHDALVQSLNIPFVLLLKSFGLDRFYALLERLGMTTLTRSAQEYGLPLIVGGAEGTLEELTGMYAGLVRCARRTDETYGESSFTPAGIVPRSKQHVESKLEDPISPAAAWMTLAALLDVVRPGEEGAWRDYLSSKNIAWKTGTSFGFRDAWAIGVTSKYAVGIWVGNADGEGRPELRGAYVAAPVLFEIFSGLPNTDWISRPKSGWKLARVCGKSGYPAGPSCAESEEIYVPEQAMVTRVCPFCRIVHLDRSGRWQVTSDCEEVSKISNVSWFVLTPAMEWFYRKIHAGYKPLPPFKQGCKEDKPAKAMSILYPEQGASLYIPIELDGKPGKTVCQAVHTNPNAIIYWHLDGMFFGETNTFHQIEFRIGPGRHVITIVDGEGNLIERSFVILSGK